MLVCYILFMFNFIFPHFKWNINMYRGCKFSALYILLVVSEIHKIWLWGVEKHWSTKSRFNRSYWANDIINYRQEMPVYRCGWNICKNHLIIRVTKSHSVAPKTTWCCYVCTVHLYKITIRINLPLFLNLMLNSGSVVNMRGGTFFFKVWCLRPFKIRS